MKTRSRSPKPGPVDFLTRKAVLPFVLAGLAFLVYATSLRGEFVFDDQAIIFRNPHLLNLTTFRQIFQLQDWRQPLYITYGLNIYLGGLEPLGYHILNVVLHAFNALVIFYILREAGAERWPALAGSTLFTVHPLLTGAVSYLAGRSSLLCGTFYFVAILGVLKGMHAAEPLRRVLW